MAHYLNHLLIPKKYTAMRFNKNAAILILTFVALKLSAQSTEQKYTQSTNVYPSPAINSISVEGILSEVELSVYNTLGEKILFFSGVSSNESLDISSLPNGIYFALYTENGITARKKFIVAK